MRKIIISCVLALLLSSCSTDDSPIEQERFEFVPIESVSVPESLFGGNIERVNYTYFQQSSCHLFSSLYFQTDVNVVTVAVVNLINSGSNCEPFDNIIEERGFDFNVASGFSNYIFRFWQGVDENEEDIYLTIEVPVTQ